MPRQALTMTLDEKIARTVFAVCAVLIGLPLYFALNFAVALAVHLVLIGGYYAYLRLIGGTMLEMAVHFFIFALLIAILVPIFQRERNKARHEAQPHPASRSLITQDGLSSP